MRLPDLTPDELDEAQQALREQIVGGPRGAGRQHFPLTTPSGALTGPFGVMLHHPALGTALQELGSAVRYATGLDDRLREVAILAVAASTGSAFEQYAHERVGRAAGLRDDEIADLAAERFTSQDPREQAAYDLCRRLLAGHARLEDGDYAHLTGVLGAKTVTELVVLVGYYRTLAQLLDVYDVAVPVDEVAPDEVPTAQ